MKCMNEIGSVSLFGYSNAKLERRRQQFCPSAAAKSINSFDGVAELREALVASCCMTPPCRLAVSNEAIGRTKRLLGRRWGTYRLSAIFGRGHYHSVALYWAKADIIPSEYIPMIWAIYPPKPDNVKALCPRVPRRKEVVVRKRPPRKGAPPSPSTLHLHLPPASSSASYLSGLRLRGTHHL